MAEAVMVPQLLEELIDDVSSSGNDFRSDSYGVVVENTVLFSKDLVWRVISELDYDDEVCLIFLLADDLSEVFCKLLRPCISAGAVLTEWLLSQQDGCWENKLIESLCIIQNYQVLGYLVPDVMNEKNRFAPYPPERSLFVNCIRKCLYLMCENLCAEELEDMMVRMRKKFPRINRTFPCEFMELNIMYWSSCRCISVGHQVDLTGLKSVLKHMNKQHLVKSLESSVRCTTLHRDGPSPLHSRMPLVDMSNTRTRHPPSPDVYDMDPDNVGVCLIINQKLFYRETNPRYQYMLVNENKTLEVRVGTDVDRDRLWEIFTSMGFMVYVKENLTHEEMLTTIKTVVNTKVNKKHSCFSLCILSHGDQGIVYGSNSVAVYTEQLEDCMKVPHLGGKPKVMILQVCQGDKLQNVVYCNDLATDGPTTRSTVESADILTFYSTVPGFASIRDHVQGTWFINEIWKVLMSERTDEDIGSLFTKVINNVTNQSALLQDGYKTMVPQQCTTLRKKLVLPHHPKFKLEVALAMYERMLLEKLQKQLIKDTLSSKHCLVLFS